MSDLPPPGWYDDPTDPPQERWWDGTTWSEQTRRKSGEVIAHQPGELRSIGDFVNHTATLLRARWDDFLLVAVIAGVIVGMAGVALLRPILQGVDIVNEEFVGWQSSYVYQLAAFTVVAGVASLVTVLACFRLAWGAATNVEEGWATAIQYAIVSSLRFLGWVIVGFLPFVAAVVAFAALARVGAGILGLALFVGLVWWSLVLSFIPVTFVSQPRGTNLIRAALEIVKGRWWRILGRLILISFFAGLVLQVVSVILSQVLGIKLHRVRIRRDRHRSIRDSQGPGRRVAVLHRPPRDGDPVDGFDCGAGCGCDRDRRRSFRSRCRHVRLQSLEHFGGHRRKIDPSSNAVHESHWRCQEVNSVASHRLRRIRSRQRRPCSRG